MTINALIANFRAANSPKAKQKKEGWSKPPPDFVKVNVDASFDEDALRGTTGVVIRDSKGIFVAACNSKIEHAFDVLTAEALALKQGLSLAQSMGCNRIVINSDSLEVIDTMKNGAISHGIAAGIFDDCYHLACDFIKVLFEYVPRESNTVAYEIARMARGSDPSIWTDEPPVSIVPLLVNDVTLISNE